MSIRAHSGDGNVVQLVACLSGMHSALSSVPNTVNWTWWHMLSSQHLGGGGRQMGRSEQALTMVCLKLA